MNKTNNTKKKKKTAQLEESPRINQQPVVAIPRV
jgi:hypothetical protein